MLMILLENVESFFIRMFEKQLLAQNSSQRVTGHVKVFQTKISKDQATFIHS